MENRLPDSHFLGFRMIVPVLDAQLFRTRFGPSLMSETIDRATVEQVARLARINLSDRQLDAASTQLGEILNYVGQLEQVELPEGVDPFFGAIESVNAIRADDVKPSLSRESILSNAPDSDGEFYSVPPVFK
jgi:aspartyl-tRNA(Asn)/glutamyl-tRNA(Gln) amidotransferase subunit C